MDNTTALNEPTSWAESVNQLDYMKKNLGWDMNDGSIKVKRINLRERRLQERELDPILMQYRDPVKEDSYLEKKNSRLMTTLDRAGSFAPKFNIITNQGPPRNSSSEKLIRHDTSTKLNLISNLMNKDHMKAPILYNQRYCDEKFVPKIIQEPNKVIPRRREFNIVSNNFYVNDAERTASEQEAIREEVTRRYWESHGYNAIVGQFYSDADEERYRAHIKDLQAVQGKSQASRVPPSITYSEGKSYNIVNHDLYDEEKLKTTLISSIRAMNKGKKVQEKQISLAAAQDAIAKRDEARRMNRIRFNKWEEQVNRGYNPVYNTLIDLTNSADALKTLPVPKRPQTVWDKVQKSINDELERAGTGKSGTGYRDLSGGSGLDPLPPSKPPSGRVETVRSSHSAVSPSLSGRLPSTASGSGRSIPKLVKSDSVPRLDMSSVEPPSPVDYLDKGGPPGQPIAMVRTGGFSGLKK